jgi:hypothetical protein
LSFAAIVTAAVALGSLLGCSGAGESAGAGAASGPLSYWHDIKPIIDANCLPCHDHGNIGPMPLTSADELRAAAGAVAQATSTKAMPPWSPADGCREYLDKRGLTDDQISTIGAWVAAGAIAGDPSDEGAPLSGQDPGLDRIDVSLTMPVTYTQKEDPDQQRCFVMDWPVDHLTYITGFGAQPGTPEVVHHIGVYVAGPDRIAQIARDDANDSGPGFDCFSGPEGASFEIAAWVPGELGRTFPQGVGYEIQPGSQVIVQMHYNDNWTGQAQPDRSTVFFKTDDHVEKKAQLIHFKGTDWVRDLFIPALSSDTSIQSNVSLGNGDAVDVQWVNVHQHYLGSSDHLNLTRQSGESECLLDVPVFNFWWQQAYFLAEPATLRPGDTLDVGCHWDNTPGHQRLVDGEPQVSEDVHWGTESAEEMCIGTVMVTRH